MCVFLYLHLRTLFLMVLNLDFFFVDLKIAIFLLRNQMYMFLLKESLI